MIDTIRINVHLRLSPAMIDQLSAWQAGTPGADAHPDWSISRTDCESAHGWRSETVRLTHRTLGFRCWVEGNYITTVEASLPRILHGCNGKLIREDAQLAKAIRRLWESLDAITIPGSRRAKLSRLDLVLHLPYSPDRLLPVLRYSKSPYVRRQTEFYNSTSVVFPGAQIRITAYDKLAQMKAGRGIFTRVEIQLKKTPAIKAHIGHRDLDKLTFAQAYKAYRDIILAFKLPSEPADKYSESRLIALCSHHNFSPWGISVMDWALQSLPKSKRRKLEAAVAKDLSGLSQIDLAECLPVDGPPEDMPDADTYSVAPQTALRSRRAM